MKKLALAFGIALVAAQPALALEAASLEADTDTAVRKDVLSRLKDPDTAAFGPISAIKRPGGDFMICGTVNAANAMGGKTGPMPFVYRNWPGSSDVYLEEFAASDRDAPRISYLCKNAGVDL